MTIAKTLKGIQTFLEENDELIKEIRVTGKNATETLKKLAGKVEKNQKELSDLGVEAGDQQFLVATDEQIKTRQKLFLEEIQEVSKKINKFKDYPAVTGHLYAERAALYLGLANTYNQTASKIITFSQEEVDEINMHLNRANLDAQQRQQWADILDGAVQLTKAGFKIALKLTV